MKSNYKGWENSVKNREIIADTEQVQRACGDNGIKINKINEALFISIKSIRFKMFCVNGISHLVYLQELRVLRT